MNKEKIWIPFLSTLAMLLLLITSLTAILTNDGGRPYPFTTLRGETIAIYGGQGLYQYDSVAKAVMFLGFDWVDLTIIVPLFILGLIWYRRGQLRGQLLLGSLFTYLAYILLIGVMGNAFNAMFLAWTGLFSIGLFGVALIVNDMDLSTIPKRLATDFPRKSLAIYMLILGTFLITQYLGEIIPAYVAGTPPSTLEIYTTLELAALELGIMAPLHLLGGMLLWKQKASGYFIATSLALAASMTFIALSIFSWVMYFSFDKGGPADLAIPIVLAMIASSFSVVIFLRVKGVT
ncbi:MAG: hypothetical protein MUO77_07975 [Anaerolineales bacterium]|nr:hypothetical protein [Anaerolineales bacterium]